MSSSRSIFRLLQIPLNSIQMRVHHTLADRSLSKVLNAPKPPQAIFKNGKAYPVGIPCEPNAEASDGFKRIPNEVLDQALDMAAENHRRSVYG